MSESLQEIFDRACRLESEDQLDESLALFDDLLTRGGSERDLFDVHYWLCRVNYRMESYVKAVLHGEEAYRSLDNVEDIYLILTTLHWTGAAHYQNANYEKALNRLIEADKLYSYDVVQNDKTMLKHFMAIKEGIGHSFFELDNYRDAIDAYKSALEFHDENKHDDRENWSTMIQYKLGESCYYCGEYRDAKTAFENVSEEELDADDLWHYLFLYGAILVEHGEFLKAQPTLKRALEFQPSAAEPKFELDILNYLGQAQHGLEKYSRSIESFKKAESILTQLESYKNTYDGFTLYYHLGCSYAYLSRFNDASVYLAKAAESLNNLRDKNFYLQSHARLYLNRAEIEIRRNKLRVASELIKQVNKDILSKENLERYELAIRQLRTYR